MKVPRRKKKNQKKIHKKKKRRSKNKGNTKKRNKAKEKSKRKKFKRRQKKIKRKKKKNKEDEKIQAKQTCKSSQISETCIKNTQEVLMYEQKKVAYYLKQMIRLQNHHKVTQKKLFKKGEFVEAAKHLVSAVGGDFTKPKCGSNSTQNATEKAELACTVDDEHHNDTHEAKHTSCNKTMFKFIKDSKKCYGLVVNNDLNATEVCECWAVAAADMKKMKDDNCETKGKQQAVTKQKRICQTVFRNCKQMEDASNHLVHMCMHDHSMHLINQTAKSLNRGIISHLRKQRLWKDIDDKIL